MERRATDDDPIAQVPESHSDRRMRLALSLAISIGAVALATAHLVWPDAELDAITLGLLVVALLPWLGAIFKTVKLPFGLEVEYWRQLQVVKERQDQLQSRVESVESLMFQFAGVASPTQEATLDSALRAYASYLDGLGLTFEGDLPKIVIDTKGHEVIADGHRGIYDPASNQIVMHPDAADDIDVALRQYTHPLLYKRQGGFAQPSVRMREVESGLADYLTCSYRNDPFVGRHGDEPDSPFHQDLAMPESFEHLPKASPGQNRIEAERAWASLFWGLRGVLGQREADALFVKSWVSGAPGKRDYDRDFVKRMVEFTPEHLRAAVDALLMTRGTPR